MLTKAKAAYLQADIKKAFKKYNVQCGFVVFTSDGHSIESMQAVNTARHEQMFELLDIFVKECKEKFTEFAKLEQQGDLAVEKDGALSIVPKIDQPENP